MIRNTGRNRATGIGAKILTFHRKCFFLKHVLISQCFTIFEIVTIFISCDAFKKRDLNNPSFKQKRKKTLVAAGKRSGKAYSPWLRTTVLERIASGISSKTVLAVAGIRDKNAPKRWKDIFQVSRDVISLKRSGGRPRIVKRHSPEEKVLEKLAKDNPYTSMEVLVCRLLNKSGIDISSRTVSPQLYSRADERFSYKTPNKPCSEDNLE